MNCWLFLHRLDCFHSSPTEFLPQQRCSIDPDLIVFPITVASLLLHFPKWSKHKWHEIKAMSAFHQSVFFHGFQGISPLHLQVTDTGKVWGFSWVISVETRHGFSNSRVIYKISRRGNHALGTRWIKSGALVNKPSLMLCFWTSLVEATLRLRVEDRYSRNAISP